MYSSIPTWNRTRTWTFGGSDAIRYTIGTTIKSRRLDSHQHQPVYKTGAFLSRATSANKHEREESNPVGQFWRPPALPGAHSYCSKGVRAELNRYLLVHSQTCRNRYTTDTIYIVIVVENAPTRIRTRNCLVRSKAVIVRFTIEAHVRHRHKRKARDSNPHPDKREPP